MSFTDLRWPEWPSYDWLDGSFNYPQARYCRIGDQYVSLGWQIGGRASLVAHKYSHYGMNISPWFTQQVEGQNPDEAMEGLWNELPARLGLEVL